MRKLTQKVWFSIHFITLLFRVIVVIIASAPCVCACACGCVRVCVWVCVCMCVYGFVCILWYLCE